MKNVLWSRVIERSATVAMAVIAITISVALSLFTISSVTRSVYAQTKPALDLAVFPGTAFVVVKPDKTLSHRVVLQHTGTIPLHVTPTVVDFNADGETGIPQLQDNLSFSSITIQNPGKKLGEPFRLEPNSKIELVLAIDPSQDQVEKEYHLAVLFKTDPAPGIIGNDTGTAASAIVVSNLILVVSNDTDNQSDIDIAKFPMPRFVDSFSQLKVHILAENSGTTAGVPQGSVTVHHWQGKKVAEWFIFPDVILAKSTRLLRATKEDPTQLPPDVEEPPALVEMVHDEPFLFGPYAVTTQLKMGDGSIQQHTITVFALPFSIVAGVGLVIVLYGIYRYGTQLLTQKRW